MLGDSHSPAESQRGDALAITRFDSFDAALPIRESWDALVERTDGDVFNTFDWCAIWWKHFGHGRKLALFVARRGEKLVAAWPLFRETLWWGPAALRVIRVVGCDHGVTTCNLTTDPDAMQRVAPGIVAALEADGPWDLLHVGEIPGYAENGAALAGAFRKSAHVGAVQFDNNAYPHAVFDVPRDYEAYLASLSVKERRNVRYDERELEKRGGSIGETQNAEDVDSAFDVLIDLHRKHWAARGRHGHFDDMPGVEAFHREIAQRFQTHGLLALLELRSNEGVIASEYALRFNRRLHWIIGGRKEDVTSRIGFCALLRGAIRDSLTLIDGLPGAYDYKRRLGARTLGVKMITVVPRGGRGAVRRTLTRAAVHAASLVYHRAWFWHFAPWLAQKTPRLSSKFVRPGLWQRFARSRFLIVGKHEAENEPGSTSGTE